MFWQHTWTNELTFSIPMHSLQKIWNNSIVPMSLIIYPSDLPLLENPIHWINTRRIWEQVRNMAVITTTTTTHTIISRFQPCYLFPKTHSCGISFSLGIGYFFLSIQCYRIHATPRCIILLLSRCSRCFLQISIHPHQYDETTISHGFPPILHHSLFDCGRSDYDGRNCPIPS